MSLDLDTLNQQLKGLSPVEIVQWATGLGKQVIATTSFAPNAAAMLNVVVEADNSIPVVWVDSGYNVPDTYRVAEVIMDKLKPNMQIYIPQWTAERRNAIMGGIPHPDDDPEVHEEFTRQVKLEPFQKALDDLAPEVWISGIRREETEFRKSLDILSYDNRGILKVAPFFYWSEEQVQDYMDSNELPSCRHYFDPTKVEDGRECGLHTSA
ncbi:MAG: phosphoadenosine phosphosulfate reductase family protein [Oceanicoccus sp.]|uniref:phosphoadenosine phosphosulfate reductase domain-containing protein n=1 Tax=Oceanicoccus sp. TaxID=2691044 RepID=UPI00261F0087|nr:phosphoadenosine phosphosulfate reductase family protein [Oceanicoccus sp.]MCP3909012.1 phosphoadenosine phosphosulfate reductase family protein [Oceanicoccus sp.]MDG1771976.1 phosphoadenosine phosphosulfate reductase family protein [Oceanicoccus sp.]